MHPYPLALGLLLFAAPSTHAPAPPPLQESPRASGVSADGLEEDVEVMRRLLVKALTEGLAPAPDTVQVALNLNQSIRSVENLQLQDWLVGVNGNQAFVAQGSVDHSSGFHVPGTGVVYSVELTVPVKHQAKSSAVQAEPEPEPQDDWADMEEAVRSGGQENASDLALNAAVSWNLFGGFPDTIEVTLDEDVVARVIDATLLTLARHGKRVEGLGQGESITVCLHLTGDEGGVANGYWNHVIGDADGDGDEDLWVANQNLHAAWLFAGHNVQTQDLDRRIVLQLDRAALHALAVRGAGASEAKAHAMVHTY